MVFGLRRWLSSLITPDFCGTQESRDCCDYDLPAPRLIPNRLLITRPSSPRYPDHLLAPGLSAPTLLLELLPLEIRQKIWRLILGGSRYQLSILPSRWRWDRLSSTRCLCIDLDKCHDGCSREYHDKASRVDNHNRPPFEMGDSLCLLTVCRQVYTEAIDILYSSNTFLVYHADDMEYLPLTILPQRMNAIRNLHLTCDFSGPPPVDVYDYVWAKGTKYERILHIRQEKWQKIWNILSEMAGLRQLHVKLRVGSEWETFNHDSAALLLKPVKQVTRPEVFVLTLPFPAMYEGIPPTTSRFPWGAINGWEGSDPWDDLPNCQIRRIAPAEL